MEATFVLYPNMTALDFVGPYEVLGSVPIVSTRFVAASLEPVKSDNGLSVVPTDTFATLAELMSTWNRPDAMEFAAIMKDHIVPHYQLLFESYEKAQTVQKDGRETKLDRQVARAAK